MLLKIVLDKQIRLFECKDALTLESLHAFVSKTFPHLNNYSLYYLDQENDQIILETKQDVAVYLQSYDKKPKIHIRKAESESASFDKTVRIVSEEVKPEPVQKNDQKVQQVKKQLQPLQDQNYQQMYPSLEREQKKEEASQKNQKNNYILHGVECCKCQQKPIKNIRYSCSKCDDLNLCQLCFEETTHKELHPFVKIRDPNSAPIQVKVKLQQPRIQTQLKQIMRQKEEQLKYQSNQERQQLIISYLQNLLGPEDYIGYCVYAKISKDKTFSKVCENYLNWSGAPPKQQTRLEKLWGWIGKKLANNLPSFHCD